MKLKNLKELEILLIAWQKEYPFTIEHEKIVNTMIKWIKALIKGKIKNQCPHGTFGGWINCMKCRPELIKKEVH